MNKFKQVALIITIMLMLKMNFTFGNYALECLQNQQQSILDVQVNYATDASAEKLVDSTPDLALDYVNENAMQVDPQDALDMFSTVMCKSVGWADTLGNRTAIHNDYIKSFVVCGYDSIYLGEPTVINKEGTEDIVFQPRKPYTYKVVQDTGSTRYYAINMGYTRTKYLQLSADGAALTYGSVNNLIEEGISESKQRQIISQVTSDVLMKSIFSQVGGKYNSTVYIPSEATYITQTNAVEGVTVMAYVSNPFGIIDSADPKTWVLGIGGTKLVREAFVGGYKDAAGKKLYCFLNSLPEGMTYSDVEVTFENARKAALAGYNFDYSSIE